MGKNIVNPAGTGELDPAQSTRIPAPGAGLHERGGSPWLGREGGASSSFLLYQQLERQLAHWMPLPEAAVAPATAAAAFLDWGVHLAASPAKQWELAQYGLEQWAQAWQSALGTAAAVRPLPQDKRFDDPAWQAAPHRVLAQSFLLLQQWWQRATTGVPGVTRHHEADGELRRAPVAGRGRAVEFHHHQPGGAATHRCRRPVRTWCVVRCRWLEDTLREALDQPPVGAEAFEVGSDIGRHAGPGGAAQPADRADPVRAEHAHGACRADPDRAGLDHEVLRARPVAAQLADPPSGRSGLHGVRDLLEEPGADDRDLGMDDYEHLGVRAALDAMQRIVPRQPVHAVGYCLGGTLLADRRRRAGPRRRRRR